MTFEWDEAKAQQNLLRHGISFDLARGVFEDVFAIEWIDRAQGATEYRFSTLGMTQGRLLFVAFTIREDTIRIISARLAEPFERRRYYHDNRT